MIWKTNTKIMISQLSKVLLQKDTNIILVVDEYSIKQSINRLLSRSRKNRFIVRMGIFVPMARIYDELLSCLIKNYVPAEDTVSFSNVRKIVDVLKKRTSQSQIVIDNCRYSFNKTQLPLLSGMVHALKGVTTFVFIFDRESLKRQVQSNDYRVKHFFKSHEFKIYDF